MSFESIFRGWMGELKTDFTQWLLLNSKEYHVFNNIIIPSLNGTTQIDHIVVSKFGIFVVETKQRSGWIFGNENSAQWTQTLYKTKISFQNPLRQNYLHTQSLAEFLQINTKQLHSVIILWGDCKFKTKKPVNVLIGWGEYTQYMRSKKEVIFTDSEVSNLCAKLKEQKDNSTFTASLQHTKSVHAHLVSITCPNCGGKLIERIRKSDESKFIGCTNWPKCKYTKTLNGK